MDYHNMDNRPRSQKVRQKKFCYFCSVSSLPAGQVNTRQKIAPPVLKLPFFEPNMLRNFSELIFALTVFARMSEKWLEVNMTEISTVYLEKLRYVYAPWYFKRVNWRLLRSQWNGFAAMYGFLHRFILTLGYRFTSVTFLGLAGNHLSNASKDILGQS